MKDESEVWVCGACGKSGPSRQAMWDIDSSCGYWAVRVKPETIVRGPNGLVRSAEAWPGGGR